MIFLDINTFYCPKAGGIRTYHQAKLDYFKNHPEHTYYLVFPGLTRKSTNAAPNIFLEEFYGLPVSKDPDGYRLILDYLSVLLLIRKRKPTVVEAGDYWLTGLFCLFSPFPKGVIRSSFYHSDPVDTYFLPWARSAGIFSPVKRNLVKGAGWLWYKLQKKYFTTLVASKAIQEKLERRNIPNLSYLPFGVHPIFLSKGKERKSAVKETDGKKIKLLYAGRLKLEKGMKVLITVLPRIIKEQNASISIAGRGKFAEYFKQLNEPSVSYLGFIQSPEEMAEIYSQHDIFLAPGAYETFGLGVMEALASGLVAVGPDQGGTGEVLENMNSDFIFRSGDAESFYQEICHAIHCDFDKEIQKSRKAAADYGNWEEAIDRMVKYYEKLCTEDRGQ